MTYSQKIIMSQEALGLFLRTNEPKRQEMYLRTCAPSENSAQHALSRSLIRIFSVRILDSQGCKVSSRGQRNLESDCADALADLSFPLVQISEGTFSHVLTVIITTTLLNIDV